jgi:hypothetical protein
MTEQPLAQPQPQISPDLQALIDAAAQQAYERGRAEAAEAMTAQAGMGTVKLAGPTHHLHLADGTVTDGTGAVPTHVSRTGDDGREVRVPVTYAYER